MSFGLGLNLGLGLRTGGGGTASDNLKARLNGQADLEGTLQGIPRNLAGSLTGSANLTGDVSVIKELAGSFTGTADLVGDLTNEWTPADLGSSLSLWLDADDASTITLNGSTVSQWDDKSGNEYHFAQATAANQPVYSTGALNGKNVISIVSSDSLIRDVIPFNDLGDNSLYIVGNRTGRTGTYNVAVVISRATARTRSILFEFGSPYAGTWGTFDNNVTQASGFVDAEYKICELIADQATNAYQFYQGGTDQGSGGRVFTNTVFSAPLCIIGNDQYGSWTEGNIAEVIFCDEKNSDSDRQKLEGYLAWKWGLESNLPIGHPYKTTPPTV